MIPLHETQAKIQDAMMARFQSNRVGEPHSHNAGVPYISYSYGISMEYGDWEERLIRYTRGIGAGQYEIIWRRFPEVTCDKERNCVTVTFWCIILGAQPEIKKTIYIN